ncbi:MAG: hypothetical protein RLY97_1496 [Pseudomonadota bacterium]|jgi:hypothetical protein
MLADGKKLKRLHRLEHIRSLAKQSALAEVARAEAMLSQLQSLSTRTAQLAGDYAARTPASTGGDLRKMAQFTDALQIILKNTQADTARAAVIADTSQTALAQAEQRRSAVESRVDALSQKIKGLREAGRETGTSLE